jgi:hypothetical protein
MYRLAGRKNMAVLEYAATSRPRFRWWQWAVAILAGALAGYVASVKAYEVMLRSLAGGMQVTIRDVREPFRQTMAIAAVFATAGVLVGLSAMFMCRFGRRNLPGRVVLLVMVFTVGAISGVVYERQVWTPRNVGRVAVGLGEVPVFTAPVVGCVAVSLVFVSVVVRRRSAARPSG